MQNHISSQRLLLGIVACLSLLSPTTILANNSKIKPAHEIKAKPDNAIKTPLIKEIKPHTAIYAISFGGFDIGHIRYRLTALKGNQMRYIIDSDLSFLLLYDQRQIISEFTLDPKNNLLTPLTFSHIRKGTGADFEESISFDQKQKRATGNFKKKVATIPYKATTFDPLNAQIQMRLDFLADKQLFHYPYISGNKIDHVSFSLVAEENVRFDDHKMLTKKVEVKRKSKKRNTYIWFSQQLGYLPYKIEDSRKGKEAIIAQLIYYEQASDKGRVAYDKIIFGKPVEVTTIHDKQKLKKKNKHHRK